MRKKGFLIAMVFMMLSLLMLAENPASVRKAHPGLQSYFFKTPNTDKTGISNFDIERITFDTENDIVLIKTIQSKKEIVKKIKSKHTDVGNFDGLYFFDDESGIGMTPYFMILYRSTKGGTMWLELDFEKQLEFEGID